MISFGLLKTLDIVKSKQTLMADKDIIDDLNTIREVCVSASPDLIC